MRKRLCFFIGEIAQDYQKLIAQSVTSKANSLGYDVALICSYGSYNEDILYAEGEKSCINLPDCSKFDGIIITEDVLDIDGIADELYGIIRRDAKCPVVYLRTTREGCYSVLTENQKSIESIVRHFTDDHGFTDICYMSGKKGLEDTIERLNGYLSVMKEKGIEVTDNMIFHGDYWRFKGKEAVEWFMKGRTTYPQAIVCANDYMGLSICDELRERGVRVPEDVCVSGFDYMDEAKYNKPSLTSLEVDFSDMAVRAVEIIDEVNNGKNVDYHQYVTAGLKLGKSCGCGIQHQYSNLIDHILDRHYLIDDTKNTLISVTEYQYAFGFDEYIKVADKYRRFIRSDKAFICLCDTKQKSFDEVEKDSSFTEDMVLASMFEKDAPIVIPNRTFKKSDMLPDEYWEGDEPNNYCFFTIHFKNIVYGYVGAKLPSDKWFDIYTQGYMMTLANAIANSEIHKKLENFEVIKAIYQNDALTGLLNRRGFDKRLKEMYASAITGGTPIGIVSVDMDNLKTINDTMGHAEGDRALITLANAIESVVEEGEICARIGGDEFAAAIILSTPDRGDIFKTKLLEALKKESARSCDYLVTSSVGICFSNESEATSLVSCVQIADERMYEEKKTHKSRSSN